MRIILHIDMDYFFAQVEERENPRFKGKPVVVGAEPELRRGVVSTANYIARQYGVHSALPISMAYRLCPGAIFLPINMALYTRVSENIMAIIRSYSPQCEAMSLDEAYLDISFTGSYQKARVLAEKLKNEILEREKLTATVGLGPNKMIAKMAASSAKPDGLLVVEPEEADAFLAPLDIEKLPGVGPKTAQKLRKAGANTIEELKTLPKQTLRSMLGKAGGRLYERARGIDDEPVQSEENVKSIGKEHTFERDTREPEAIFGAFEGLIKGVHQEVAGHGFSFRTITVRCRYQGFETHTKAITLKEPTQDISRLEKEAKKLLLRFIMESPKMIRLIGLRVSALACPELAEGIR